MKLKAFLYFLFTVVASVACAQSTITGQVMTDGVALSGATVALKGTSISSVTNAEGKFELHGVSYGAYTVVVFFVGKQTIEHPIQVAREKVVLLFTMTDLEGALSEVVIEDKREQALGLTRLQSVENFSINEGKKNEVILLQNITANLSTNNPRQIYSRITGLNIWESDGAGLQLGIGGRGLSPDRTSNFNTRQNGYDISADALGYPESYYTPPVEALDRIEIIRGAASLQYGTQFGGMLNFRFREGPSDKKIELTSRQTFGSWNYFGTFNSIGGTVAKKKLNYYTYYQYKTGDGYRPNSDFDYHNAYASVKYQATEKLLLNIDFTHMNYLAHQPGGLTDKMFEDDARQSVRERNWFSVDWNLLAVTLNYSFTPRTQLNIRNFGLLAKRQSLGNLERIHVADNGGNRTLIDGTFKNFGNETRLLHRYQWLNKTHAFIAGVRLYRGHSASKQGDGNDGSQPDFYFVKPDSLDSDYEFPNYNYSAFVENIFEINEKLSITPGIRFENIQTFSDGYYTTRLTDGAGNIISETQTPEQLEKRRSFIIGGVGVSYRINDRIELYSNISQNYRAVNFTDLQIVNPNTYIDPDIHDEKGFTADGGIRGSANDKFTYDVTMFYVAYKDRIGQMERPHPVLGNSSRYKGNIADARIVGIEAFTEFNLTNFLKVNPSLQWTAFINASVISAHYLEGDDNSVEGNEVEMVPPVLVRTGTSLKWKSIGATLQYAYTSEHFSDASNAELTSTAVEGIIPAYQVMDLSLSYTWKHFKLEGSCNNLLNEQYFTRRADSYPGPGIIPADGRGFYFTLQGKF